MSFTLVAYDTLKISIRQSIVNEIKSKNGLDPTKLEESLKDPQLADRKHQIMFLLKMMELLDAYHPVGEKDTRNKARILNAAAYFKYEEIKVTYNLLSPDRSELCKGLKISLNLNTENTPDKIDQANLYKALEKFLRLHTYNDPSDPRKGYLEDQPFGFDTYKVKKDIKTLTEKLNGWRLETLDEAEAEHMKTLEAKKPKSSLLGGLFGSSTPTPKATKEEYKGLVL